MISMRFLVGNLLCRWKLLQFRTGRQKQGRSGIGVLAVGSASQDSSYLFSQDAVAEVALSPPALLPSKLSVERSPGCQRAPHSYLKEQDS